MFQVMSNSAADSPCNAVDGTPAADYSKIIDGVVNPNIFHKWISASINTLQLTLAVAFLYTWLLAVGGRTIQAGLRPLIDRHDRRDLSIFQIGSTHQSM